MPRNASFAGPEPAVVAIDGEEFRVGRLTARDLSDLQEHLRRSVPDPMIRVAEICRGLPDPAAVRAWDDLSPAARDWPPSILSAQGSFLLTTAADGAACLLMVILRRHNEGIDLERCRRLADRLPFDAVTRLFAMALPQPTIADAAPEPGAAETT